MLEVSLPDFEIRDESLLYELLDLLPSHSEALYFCDLYLEYGNVLCVLLWPNTSYEMSQRYLPGTPRSPEKSFLTRF